MTADEILIDGSNHIAGVLGSFISKQLLEGKKVTVIRAESVGFTGNITRHKGKYEDFLNKRCPYNPRRGPFHWSEPSKFFKRVIKRMLPYKKKKGSEALKRLTIYEGIPENYIGKIPNIHPKSLFAFRSNPIRKMCLMGDLLSCYGWKHSASTKVLTDKAIEQMNENIKKEEEIKERRNEFINSAEFEKLYLKELENYE